MTWAGPDDVRCCPQPPQTAAEWLGVQQRVFALLALDAGTDRHVDPATVRALLDWCARHTAWVEGYGVRVDGPDVAGVLDAWLSVQQMAEYAHHIVETSGLPPRLARHTARILEVIADHGCECRSCQPKSADPHAPRPERGERCRYYGVPLAAEAVVGRWWPMRDETSYDAPVWAYQLSRQWSEAQGKRAAKEAESKRNAQQLMNELKSRGLA